jgi:hypothetical protein
MLRSVGIDAEPPAPELAAAVDSVALRPASRRAVPSPLAGLIDEVRACRRTPERAFRQPSAATGRESAGRGAGRGG